MQAMITEDAKKLQGQLRTTLAPVQAIITSLTSIAATGMTPKAYGRLAKNYPLSSCAMSPPKGDLLGGGNTGGSNGGSGGGTNSVGGSLGGSRGGRLPTTGTYLLGSQVGRGQGVLRRVEQHSSAALPTVLHACQAKRCLSPSRLPAAAPVLCGPVLAVQSAVALHALHAWICAQHAQHPGEAGRKVGASQQQQQQQQQAAAAAAARALRPTAPGMLQCLPLNNGNEN